MENISISQQQVSVNDEMLTVSFSQCVLDDKNTANISDTPQIPSTANIEGELEAKYDAQLLSVDTKNETDLPPACQYFMSETSPKRTRTTSDNEFFDHLVAGDTAIMCDENVEESVTENLPTEMKHSNSFAKLEIADNAQTETQPITDQDGIDGVKFSKTDEKASTEEEIPVFRYFADSSINPEPTLSGFDTIPGLGTKDTVPNSDDVFSVALQESELNRRCDAWIPSSSTVEYFASYVESNCDPPVSFTHPKLVLETILTDPVSILMTTAKVDQQLTNARRDNILTEESVATNENGLKKLMEAECYRAAINLTAKMINQPSDGRKLSSQLLQLWFCRIGLLVKVKMFNEAYDESQVFAPNFDNPDLFYRFYPVLYTGREGSMVPFGFRLLLAELPRYVGKYQDALGRLYELLNTVKKINQNLNDGVAEDGSNLEITEINRKASMNLWQQRELKVVYSLVNAVTSHKDYSLAIRLMTSLIDMESSQKKPHLWSGLGRIYLQLGDIYGAQDAFNQASSTIVDDSKNSQEFLVMELMNKAMMAIAQNNYREACQHYQTASKMDPSNPTLQNNIAVCKLYTGEMKQSLSNLESSIMNEPKSYLHEGILFNVCTLYDLESSQSSAKKLDMLELTSKHKGDSFNTVCLKIA